ncbi:Enoyl-(Acyl carrier protein) reductase [Azotobacter beijerinckii]|uniref:Peroxisomal trans-2-enoyl-CoA reductase n=1 Tax=Azotobacter beijerinckii TaxID=170623 RepID=A0A1H6YKU9_9GAMM|nr:Enoyl-(Acyl carrier protein) reductase [Azotobacter beijerinckii]
MYCHRQARELRGGEQGNGVERRTPPAQGVEQPGGELALALNPGGLVDNTLPMASGIFASEAAALPFRKHTPLQRIGQPEEVADALVWLLSDEARFITGQRLLVDGVFTLGGLRPWFNSFVAEHIG